FETSGFTTPDGKIAIDKKINEAGWYVVESFAVDRFGDTVKDKRFIQLYNDKLVSPEMTVKLVSDKTELQQGETAHYKMQTNVDSAYVVSEIVRTRIDSNPSVSLPGKPVAGAITAQRNDMSGVLI